jgi:hypothetical protein
MPTKAAPTAEKSRMGFADDILWLGITAFVLTLIVGIVCWPLSAELSPRLLAGPVPDKQTSGLTPEGGATSATAGAPSGALSVNRLPLLGTARTKEDAVGEGSSSTTLTTSIAAPTDLGEIKLSFLDPNPDRRPGEYFLDHKKLTPPAPPAPQPGQFASASSPTPQLGPRRPRQNRQPARAVAPGPELVPW